MTTWTHNPKNQTLQLHHPQTGNFRYEVDLERCKDSAATLDWVCQVAKKQWADDHTLADLVRQLDTILDPQATMCSWGIQR